MPLDLSLAFIDTFDSIFLIRSAPLTVFQEILDRLIKLEAKLSDRPDEANEVRAIRELLDSDGGRWIGTVEARKFLGVQSVNTVKAWAKRGLLRSRRLPNGRLMISFEDVLEERWRSEPRPVYLGNE
jgi:hypothetical protein